MAPRRSSTASAVGDQSLSPFPSFVPLVARARELARALVGLFLARFLQFFAKACLAHAGSWQDKHYNYDAPMQMHGKTRSFLDPDFSFGFFSPCFCDDLRG
jgi:hypothetical protein